jgi:predicted metal-dependent hydrolase
VKSLFFRVLTRGSEHNGPEVLTLREPYLGHASSETTTSQLSLPFEPVVVFVRHARARRYVIRVAGDGTVRVTLPRWGSKREAAAFAEQERTWIEKQQRRLEQARQSTQPAAIDPELERELRQRATRELPRRLLELAAEHGFAVTRVSVRNQRWRWGSCSRNGHVCLNWRLVKMPDSVRDYVMIHELMHLKRMDHSQKFWKLVAAACPDFKASRAWLRSHSKEQC